MASHVETTGTQGKDPDKTKVPRYIEFLPKPELFYPVMLNKHQYRKIRFERYRHKKCQASNASKVRYIERQKLAQRRFRLHGKFVSKQVQIAMASSSHPSTTGESFMELEQSINMNIFEDSFFRSIFPSQDEASNTFHWNMDPIELDESDMFQDSYWLLSQNIIEFEYEEAEQVVAKLNKQ
ncbi:hypothetical protein GpartN1_g2293.t1 [Galdieria partita]|uniref:CCT domain-containing protein n=1 Tax=Galdieria partita TaxID=83374 RepID=A0A9C7PV47_9RHOD|nr:hypothetical protein GpartN1_g2293.t1 [Galdieria partita]